MTIRPEYAAKLDKFWQDYGHHYDPPAEERPVDVPGEGMHPEVHADRNVAGYIGGVHERLGMPNDGPQAAAKLAGEHAGASASPTSGGVPDWLRAQQQQRQERSGAWAPENLHPEKYSQIDRSPLTPLKPPVFNDSGFNAFDMLKNGTPLPPPIRPGQSFVTSAPGTTGPHFMSDADKRAYLHPLDYSSPASVAGSFARRGADALIDHAADGWHSPAIDRAHERLGGAADTIGGGAPYLLAPEAMGAYHLGHAGREASEGRLGPAAIEAAVTPLMLPGARAAAGSALEKALAAAGSDTAKSTGSKIALGTGGLALGNAASQDAMAAGVKREETAVNTPETALASGVHGDAKGQALLSAYQEALKRSTAKVEGVNAAGSDAVRAKAAAEANTLRSQLIDRITELHPPKQTFSQAYPNVSAALPMLQLGAPAVAGAYLKGASNMREQISQAPWTAAIRKGDAAIEPSGGVMGRMFGSEPNIARGEHFATKASKFAEAYEKANPSQTGGNAFTNGARNMLGGAGVPMVTGGTIGAELALLPHQFNRNNAPEDSPEYKKAGEVFSSPFDVAKTAIPGIAMGSLGGWSGSKLIHPITKPGAPPLAETEALNANIARLKQRASSSPPDGGGPQKSQVPAVAGQGEGGSGTGPTQRNGFGTSSPIVQVATGQDGPSRAFPVPNSYDRSVYGPVSDRYLDEILTHNSSTRNAFLNSKNPIEGVKNDLLGRYEHAGLPRLNPAELHEPASNSIQELHRLETVIPQTNSQITNPRLREALMNMIRGNRGQLAIAPPLLGAGANAFSSHEPDTTEDLHHSNFMPRRRDGTFRGPPSQDYYD